MWLLEPHIESEFCNIMAQSILLGGIRLLIGGYGGSLEEGNVMMYIKLTGSMIRALKFEKAINS